MRNLLLISSLFILALSCTAYADIIYLKNGNAIEVEDAVIKGEYVYFSIYTGSMAIELSAVDRIEKIARTVTSSPTLRTGISGSGLTTARGQGTAAVQPGGPGTETVSEQSGETNEEILQFFISQKLQLERENFFYQQQISTLNSVIYAKSAIFSDTSEERRRIEEMEGQIRQNNGRIAQLLRDARLQGLLPGDIRQIEDAKFKSPIEQTKPLIMGSEEEQPIYQEETEEPIYYEEPEEPEETPPPGRS